MNISRKTNSATDTATAGGLVNYIIHTHHYDDEDSESEYEEALDDDLLERELRGFQRRQKRESNDKNGKLTDSSFKNHTKSQEQTQSPRSMRRQGKRRTQRTDKKSRNARPGKIAMRTYYHTSDSEGDTSDDGTAFSRDTPKRGGKKMSDRSVRTNEMSPQTCLEDILRGATAASNLESNTWDVYFQGVTEERIAVYSAKVAKAVRENDLPRLRELYERNSTTTVSTLEGCSADGESLLHVACRMRHLEMVQFILEEQAAVGATRRPLRVQDGTGRTPLHEACWNNHPNLELILLLLQTSPELLFVRDQRGFAALEYVPKTSWDLWSAFLRRHAAMIRLKVNHSGYQKSRDSLNEAQHKMQALLVQRQQQ